MYLRWVENGTLNPRLIVLSHMLGGFSSIFWVSQVVQVVKIPPASAGDTDTWVRSLGPKDLLEKGMETRSNILAWKSPWTEEPGRLKYMGPQRVRHD